MTDDYYETTFLDRFDKAEEWQLEDNLFLATMNCFYFISCTDFESYKENDNEVCTSILKVGNRFFKFKYIIVNSGCGNESIKYIYLKEIK